ncbi:MAG: hypothetical protein COB77_01230 [Gammaproteobacteria bacterium]|nr:MAG: hypothetical protein COB77_01230 [Gammaproteobacteria bacterium]
MNNCCTQKETLKAYPPTLHCPANGKLYNKVKRKTILHHLLSPWSFTLHEQGYYFCTDPECGVVYFGQDKTRIAVDDVRTTLWQKTNDAHSFICYCFGVTKSLALSDEGIKDFVKTQTKNALCSCETSNPSGRCCLKDFPTTKNQA